jgi:hypothetical protein
LAVALMFAFGAFAEQREMSSQSSIVYGGPAVKAVTDTVDLMGPGGSSKAFYPYRGNFENVSAKPGGAGLLLDGWYSVDETAPINYWNASIYHNPFTGKAAWFGAMVPACSGETEPGGYMSNWRGTLEYRKTVTAAATVHLVFDIAWDSEPGYDYTYLMRRTVLNPAFEDPADAGNGMSWNGNGQTLAQEYSFHYDAAELLGGNEIVVGFVFEADGGWDDGDCLNATDGAVRIDNVTVTVTLDSGPLVGTPYLNDFEAGLGQWNAIPNQGVGDFARVWTQLGDVDDCASNYTKLIAYIDDGLVVPGTGGTTGGPGMDYGPPGGYIVNNTGGLLTLTDHINIGVYSPIMDLPVGMDGVTWAADCYRHELLTLNDSPGIFYTWGVRSAAAGNDIELAGWMSRNFVYYGGPNYLRVGGVVDDLMAPGATTVQLTLGVIELGWSFGYGNGTNGTPAPYFDNVSVKAYTTSSGPRIVTDEIRFANDAFPAIPTIDYANLGANSCRFDMAASVAVRTHLWNDPGDSIWIDCTARNGAVLETPVMHWAFAVKNPLFTDAMRNTLAPGQITGTVTGNVTYTWKYVAGVLTPPHAIVANRFNFDLPDTGMLFPGDVLHYYFSATDAIDGGTPVTSTAPINLTGFGTDTDTYDTRFTVDCLPSMGGTGLAGQQPSLLFWNDFGYRGGEDEWFGALSALGLQKGVNYDVYTTNGPSSGVGNGLGGRAVAAHIKYYTDMLYTCGDINAMAMGTTTDRSLDIPLMNEWFAEPNRDLFMTGDDLNSNMAAVSLTFLETKMGVSYAGDTDIRDNIGGQTTPLVVKVAGNPVFLTANSWIAYGGCFGINDFDVVTPYAGATRLAQFTAPGGVSTPYPYAAAILNIAGDDKVISMNHDFYFVMSPHKAPAPITSRARLLSDVLNYFGVSNNPGNTVDTDLPVARFGVDSYPNPFNPSLTIKYTLKNPGNVVMKVYNVRGELVKTLLNSFVETPSPIVWDGSNDQGSNVSSGVYFVETRSGGDVNVQKATMVK